MNALKLQQAVPCFQQGDFSGARRLCQQILRRESANANAWHLLGVACLSAGDAVAALEALKRARTYAPNDAAIAENLAVAHLAAGQAPAAELLLRQLIARGDSKGSVHMRHGLALHQLGRLPEAEKALRRAMQTEVGEPDVYLNLSNVLAAAGRIDDALEILDGALLRWPGHRDAHYNRGTLLQMQRRFEEAAQACEAALAADPLYLDACNNRGVALEHLGRLDEAAACYRKALTINPSSAHALSNLAKVLRAQGRLDEAADCCLRALQADANFADALLNLAGVRAEQGDTPQAIQRYQQLLAVAPQDADAHLSYGMLCLGSGQFSEGWRHYQWRPQRRQMLAAGVALTECLPADLSGQRLLLIGEQGLGDEVFFLRYAPLLRERGARLLAFCDAKIATLVERTNLFEHIATHGGVPPPADWRVAMGDLPLVTGASACAQPLQLTALRARTDALSARLAALGPPPYFGLTWRAGTPPEQQIGRIDRALFKHVPIELLAEALKPVRGTWLALQRLPHPGELDSLKAGMACEIHDFSALNDDLEDMLALLGLIDDYVGVSNTNVHLMAGVGGRAHVLVPNPPEWRWMTDGEVSPWFPRCQIYRQAIGGDWLGELAALVRDMLLSSAKKN